MPAPTPNPTSRPTPTPSLRPTSAATFPTTLPSPTQTPTPRPSSKRMLRRMILKDLVLVVPCWRGKVNIAQVFKGFARCSKDKKGRKGKCLPESGEDKMKKIGKGRTRKMGKSKKSGKTGERS